MQRDQMMTRPMVLPAEHADATLGYPTNRLTSVLDDWTSVTRVAQALAAVGVDPAAIEVLHGAEGVRRLGPQRPDGGLLGRLTSRLPELGPERALMRAYEQELRSGHALLVLCQPDRQLWPAIVRELASHRGRLTRYFGRYAVHVLAT
jgi:hypothetical protein